MKKNALFIVMLLSFFFILSCKQNQEVRRPISHSSGSFIRESIERNKKLNAEEEVKIKKIIAANKTAKYYASTSGFWYTYIAQNKTDTLRPKVGDVALFEYEVKNLAGEIIYSKTELKPQIYAIDKQNIMMGIRKGIKLMHRNETVEFIFPSDLGYGYHGDNDKIGGGEPLICTVTLHNFKPDTKTAK